MHVAIGSKNKVFGLGRMLTFNREVAEKMTLTRCVHKWLGGS